jgi:hypothetical protein
MRVKRIIVMINPHYKAKRRQKLNYSIINYFKLILQHILEVKIHNKRLIIKKYKN